MRKTHETEIIFLASKFLIAASENFVSSHVPNNENKGRVPAMDLMASN